MRSRRQQVWYLKRGLFLGCTVFSVISCGLDKKELRSLPLSMMTIISSCELCPVSSFHPNCLQEGPHISTVIWGNCGLAICIFSSWRKKKLRKTQHHIWASGWSIRKGNSDRQLVFPTFASLQQLLSSLTCHVDRVAKALQRAHKPQAETSGASGLCPPPPRLPGGIPQRDDLNCHSNKVWRSVV